MSYKKAFPETVLKTADVLGVGGALNIGCYVSDGKLMPALNSVKALITVPDSVEAAWYSALAKKYIVSGDGALWIYSGEVCELTTELVCTVTPSFMEIYTDDAYSVIIAGDTDYYSLYDCLGSISPFIGRIHSCVLKNGRIFGIDNSNSHKIKWSGAGGIYDWSYGISGAGWTIVQNGYGNILNLIVYRDKIVALREYGLTFLSAYGNPENYKLSYHERKIPKIYPDTAAVVDENLWFYTDDGLYVYDGSRVSKSNIGLADEIREPCSVACFGGKYFLCGESKTLGRKCVLVADSLLNVSYIIDVAAEAVCAGDRIFAYKDSVGYEVAEGGEYSFKSGEIDFSSSGYKVLKEVILDGADGVQLEVSNGVISRIVRGVRGKFRPNMRGKSFKITVRGRGKIKGVTAVAEVPFEV